MRYNGVLFLNVQEIEPGIFSRASEQVLKQRKIVRARRPGAAAVAGGPTAPASANPFANVQLAPGGAAATPSANPFAGISLVKPPSPAAEPEAKQQAASTAAPAPVTADKEGEPESKDATADKESEPVKAAEDAEPPAADKPAAGGFGALSSTAPGLSFGSSGGFGALSSSAGGFGGFASAASGAAFGAPANGSSGAAFSFLAAPPASEGGASAPSVFGTATATGTALFGGDAPKHATAELPAEVPVSTGEEAEQSVFTGDGILFEFDAGKQWRERGRGQIKVNVDPAKGQGRLVMRQKGNLRLLLNANLWPEMQVTRMDGGVVSSILKRSRAGNVAL